MHKKSLDSIDVFDLQGENNRTKQYIQPSNINVFSSLEHFSSLQLQPTKKECRICLQQIQDAEHKFVSPCKCTGSLKFVHQKCFAMWLDRLYNSKSTTQQKILTSTGLPCEICKQKMYLSFKDQLLCLKKSEIKEKIEQNLLVFSMLIIFEIIIFSSLTFVIIFMNNPNDSFGKDIATSVVTVCALLFLIAAAILSFYFLITRYCMERKSKLQSFQPYQRVPRIKNKRKVIPTPLS